MTSSDRPWREMARRCGRLIATFPPSTSSGMPSSIDILQQIASE
jgi:hypothetical protein